MGAPAKYLFDLDFSVPDKARERAISTKEIAEQIAAAEARGYRTGFDAAQREAKVESDRRSALALEEIGTAIRTIAARFSGIEARMETEAVDVAVSAARKLCSELVAREPRTEVAALGSDCFRPLRCAQRYAGRGAADRSRGAGERLLPPPGLDAAFGGPDQRPALRRRAGADRNDG